MSALRLALAIALVIAILALFGWILWDMVHCWQTGGTFVKGLPWYTCVGGER